MFEKMSLKIDSDQGIIDSDVIGLDLGQTLSKVAYYEEGQIMLALGETISNLKEISEFLNTNKRRYKKVNLTGGKGMTSLKIDSKVTLPGNPLETP